jgi:hypothetical protein
MPDFCATTSSRLNVLAVTACLRVAVGPSEGACNGACLSYCMGSDGHSLWHGIAPQRATDAVTNIGDVKERFAAVDQGSGSGQTKSVREKMPSSRSDLPMTGTCGARLGFHI